MLGVRLELSEGGRITAARADGACRGSAPTRPRLRWGYQADALLVSLKLAPAGENARKSVGLGTVLLLGIGTGLAAGHVSLRG